MVDQDMLYKAGLMIAVLVLAGLFGSSLAQSMEKGSDMSLDRIASDLRSVFMNMHASGSGSSVILSFDNHQNNQHSDRR
jgi:hypothetical protein